MHYICDRCKRDFKSKAGLARHMKRKTPCRIAMYMCTDCNKSFVSHQSLGKHKLLYCRSRSGNRTPLSDILATLVDQGEMDVTNSKPLDDSCEEKPLETNAGETRELPAAIHPTATNYFDEVLGSWIDQLFMLEGKFHGGMTTYGDAFGIIDRMLEDGLISVFEHGDLYYTTRLFIRLHNIYQMGMITRLREEYVDIILSLFEMKKLSKDVLRYLLVNL